LFFAPLAYAEKTIPLEDNSLILGEWKLYAETAALLKVRIIMIMNTHSYDREHLLYSRIGSDVFLL